MLLLQSQDVPATGFLETKRGWVRWGAGGGRPAASQQIDSFWELWSSSVLMNSSLLTVEMEGMSIPALSRIVQGSCSRLAESSLKKDPTLRPAGHSGKNCTVLRQTSKLLRAARRRVNGIPL